MSLTDYLLRELGYRFLTTLDKNNDLHNSLLTKHSENVNIAMAKDGLIWKSFVSHYTRIGRKLP